MLNIATYSRNSQLLDGDKLDCIWWINLFFVVFCFKVIQFVLGPKSSRITVNMYDRRTPDRDLRRYGPIWVDRIESLVLEFNCESGDADVRGISMSGTYFRKKESEESESGLLRERHSRRKPMLQYRYIDCIALLSSPCRRVFVNKYDSAFILIFFNLKLTFFIEIN